MALFDVPGWTMPSDMQPATPDHPRKRKRPSIQGSTDKIHTAEVNLEKLMRKLGKEGRADDRMSKGAIDSDSLGNVKSKTKKVSSITYGPAGSDMSQRSAGASPPRQRKKPKNETRVRADAASSVDRGSASAPEPSNVTQARPEGEGKARKKDSHDKRKSDSRKPSAGVSHQHEGSSQTEALDTRLTSLQSKMKQSLDGARFRWINETLYKSSSKEAQRLMRDDPKVFDEYHTGFRHQVTSWPSNPVEHFVDTLSVYPEQTVIVDLGCGDAALAQNLTSKGFTLLSYDLVAANPFVVAVDICDKLPLPGAEDKDEGQVVDVVVCSLSLMSTNWLNCVREARRILKTGGELKIAEVTSRFTNADKFTSVISSVGFRLVSKDERNSHFTIFDFKKSGGSRSLDDKSWQKIVSRGDVLQACEYKRR